MKKFKANSIDLNKMENIRGGDKTDTYSPELKFTKRQQVIAQTDSGVEICISAVVEV